jgi:predicted nucleic acid-binding protein
VALSNPFSPYFLWRPILRDAKDDMVLELAVVSGAESIITFNTRDFEGSLKFGIKAVGPLDYLRKEKLL